jgi:4-amino-4-deoxy-L-arabinose transferase-like glycosyltransferase
MAAEFHGLSAGLLLLSLVAAVAAIWISLLRQATRPDWPLALFLSLVGVVIVFGALGVVLAWLGRFSLDAISIIVLLASIVALWRLRPLPRLTWQRPARYDLGLAALLMSCAVVYLRPHEYVLGGADAHTYMNIGATLARTGEFVVQDEWTSFLRQYADVTLRQQPAPFSTEYLQFVGWYVDDHDPERIIPQFYPFHPVLIALGVSLGGMPTGLLVTPLWGVLSIAAVYFAARRWFGPPVGLLAAALLAVTPTHIFFARYPTTEMLTLLLVFSGMLVFQVLWDDRTAGGLWGVLGGAAFGAAFLTRIDLPVLVALLLTALMVVQLRRQWSRSWSAFAATLGVFLALMVFDAVFVNWPYVWNTYSAVLGLLMRSLLIGVAALLSLMVLFGIGVMAWRRRASLKHSRVRRFVSSQRCRWLLAAGIALLSAYAYFVRPVVEPIRWATTWPSLNRFPVLDGQNWVRLGWYVTPLGILLATLGLILIVKRESLMRLSLFLAVGVLTIVQYVYNIFSTPYHIYAMRRYVPIVIPMLMIYAAYAIIRIGRAHFRGARLAAGALALLLSVGLLYQARFVLPQRDLRGAVDQIAALNARLQPNAIVLISEPAESAFADTFGAPLRFTFGHDIATVHADGPRAQEFLKALLARAKAEHRPVQLLAVDPISTSVRETLHLAPVAMFPVKLQQLMNTFFDYPSVMQTAYYGIEIYDVEDRRATMASQPAHVEIDVGEMDTRYLRSGFYAKEPLPGLTARWTTGDAVVDLPLSAAQPVTVAVRAMIYRPAAAPPAEVGVYLDGQEIGRFVPDEAWQIFAFSGQAQPTGGRSTLAFKTSTFNPAQMQVSGDARDLGFLLDYITVTPHA